MGIGRIGLRALLTALLSLFGAPLHAQYAGGTNDGWHFAESAVLGLPGTGPEITIRSARHQYFRVGQPPTAMEPISIVDDTGAVAPANDLRIRIPLALDVVWATNNVPALGGAAAGKVAPVVTYEDSGKTLVVDVTNAFVAGDALVISGLLFTDFTAAGSPDVRHHLELDIDNDGTAYVVDSMAKQVAGVDDHGPNVPGGSGDGWDLEKSASVGLPGVGPVVTMASARHQYFRNGQAPAAIEPITIVDETGGISAVDDIRIRIPAGLDMTWSTGDTIAALSGSAAAKVATTVSYEGSGTILVLDVTSAFAAGESLTIAGLGYANFAAPPGAENAYRLELDILDSDMAYGRDEKLIQIVADEGHGPKFIGGLGDGWDLVKSAPLALPGIGPAVTVTSARHQYFIASGPAREIATITVDDLSGGVTAADDLRLRIPPDLHLVWDTSDTTAVIGGDAAAKVGATVTYEEGGKTLALNVTSDFAAGDTVEISGLSFVPLASGDPQPELKHLELDIYNSGATYAFDRNGIQVLDLTEHGPTFIGGLGDGWDQRKSGTFVLPGIGPTVTVTSARHQFFIAGQAASAIAPITIDDFSGGVAASNDLRIRIPEELNMAWDTNDTVAAIVGNAAGKVSAAVAYEGSGRVLALDVTNDFAAGDAITVSGLSFTDFAAGGHEDNLSYLELDIYDSDAAYVFDSKAIQILSPPTHGPRFPGGTGDGWDLRKSAPLALPGTGPDVTLASAADQVFAMGLATGTAATITVTDNGGAITAVDDIRVRVPPALTMGWDTNAVAPALGGSAAGKVAGAVAYEDAGRTLTLDVTNNFAPGDVITVSNLAFTGFGMPSGPDNLELEIYNDGLTYALDSQTVTIVGLTISSADDQTFVVGQAATAIETITITDPSGMIGSNSDLRISIPAGFNAIWDSGDTEAVIGGAAAAKVSTTVSYENADRTLVLDVVSDFASGDVVTVSGLLYDNFSAASAADNLEADASDDGTADGIDLRYIEVVDPPDTTPVFGGGINDGWAYDESATFTLPGDVPNATLSSAQHQRFLVGQGPEPIDAITITDVDGGITAGSDIRVHIPVVFNMVWETGDTNAVMTGSGATNVAAVVAYEQAGKVLLIDVTNDFSAGEAVTVSGLSVAGFAAASPLDRLGLGVEGAGAVNAVDDKFIEVSATVDPFYTGGTNDGWAYAESTNVVLPGLGPNVTIASVQHQDFVVGQAPAEIATITITDVDGGGITASNDLRVHIPVTFNMLWDTGDTNAVIAGSASNKVAAPVGYESGDKVLTLDVVSDFGTGDFVTVSGLSFASFTASSDHDRLGLGVDTNGALHAVDDKLIGIAEAIDPYFGDAGGGDGWAMDESAPLTLPGIEPGVTMSSDQHQYFTRGQAPVAAARVVITDVDGGGVTVGKDIRLRIPLGFDMTWVTTETVADLGGSAAAKVNPVVAYEPGGKVVVLDVVVNFAAGETLVVGGLSFAGFSTVSAPDHLQLDVANSGSGAVTDDKFIQIVREHLSDPLYTGGDGRGWARATIRASIVYLPGAMILLR